MNTVEAVCTTTPRTWNNPGWLGIQMRMRRSPSPRPRRFLRMIYRPRRAFASRVVRCTGAAHPRAERSRQNRAMTGNAIGEQLREELRELDTQIAELRGVGRQVGAESDAVRDSEEIAADLTNAEEQEAVLGILERRREATLDQLRQLDA